MPLWIAVTLLAALFQCWRTALQQQLRGTLSVNAAAVVRYLYGVPPGLLFLLLYMWATGGSLPRPDLGFLALCALGGLSQILGTVALIASFGHRGFAVGTAYSKTEAVQSAILGLVLLGDIVPPIAWLGIAISVSGVLYLSMSGRVSSLGEALRATGQPAALLGLAAGLGFSVTAICVRAATRHLEAPDPVLTALFMLVLTNFLQTLMQGAWLLWREPASVRAVLVTWRSSAQVGFLSACGSACWFTAFALAPIALVRAVGQTEILFTLAFSRWFLKERMRPQEVAGALCVVTGVVLVVLFR